MKNKGLIKFFALLFGIVCIYQLVLTFQFNLVESEAVQYSTRMISDSEQNFDTKRRDIKLNYLDSIANLPVFNFLSFEWTYEELKKESMKLGLDLKGGINAILQISVKEILENLASSNDKDPIFNKALTNAEEMQKNSQNTYLEDFFIAFDEINHKEWPGETLAVLEECGIKNLEIKRYEFDSVRSYAIIK